MQHLAVALLFCSGLCFIISLCCLCKVLSALFWFKLLNAMKSSGYQALPVLRVLCCDQAMPS